jgi:hypothetical protein
MLQLNINVDAGKMRNESIFRNSLYIASYAFEWQATISHLWILLSEKCYNVHLKYVPGCGGLIQVISAHFCHIPRQNTNDK